MINRTNLLLTVLTSVVVILGASQESVAQASESREQVLQRVQTLEQQVEMFQTELTKLRNLLAENQNTTTQPKPAAASTENAKVAPRKQEAATKQLSGFELGPIRAIPYGTIYFNAFGNSGGTNNADVPLFATPTNQGNVGMSVRQTRLGLKLEGPTVAHAKVRAQVEADFFGGFPAVGIGDNFGLVRLRLALVRLEWEKTALEAGQDWMVFAPNNPVSIAAAAIPQMAAAGNPWARLPQIRLERRWASGKVLLQAAALAPSTGDSPTATSSSFFLQPGSGGVSRVPFLQSRLSINSANWFGTGKTGAIGISTHYGRSKVGNNESDSVGLASDWTIPLVPRLLISGEAFVGRNLGGFQAGAFQSLNTDFAYRNGTVLRSGGIRSIGTRGGWIQVGFTPPVFDNVLTLYGTYGIDDPRNSDLVSLNKHDWRLRNQAIALSFLYKITPQFSWGVEFRHFNTDFLQSGKQTANHLNLGGAFSF
jgi:hypothetical protein